MISTAIDLEIDACGFAAPMPVVATARAMKTVPSGQLVEVLATDAGSLEDFPAWSKASGNPIVESSARAGVYRFVIRRT